MNLEKLFRAKLAKNAKKNNQNQTLVLNAIGLG